jgi:hypothetical protein
LSYSTVRIPQDLYQSLRDIRLTLENEHYSAAPSVQDLVTVAIKRLIADWHNPSIQSELLEDLLEHRKEARGRMGKRKSKSN